ncbi:unnamed protein product [Cuscuta epithymum]|uniref:Uncharacterized protein n=1 Tax=Cuscuta epithymum TaxID=186058 RepID=A0AAV0D0Y1_9ASTE|nr:unnamed protein product [Cuscuta epithymum]
MARGVSSAVNGGKKETPTKKEETNRRSRRDNAPTKHVVLGRGDRNSVLFFQNILDGFFGKVQKPALHLKTEIVVGVIFRERAAGGEAIGVQEADSVHRGRESEGELRRAEEVAGPTGRFQEIDDGDDRGEGIVREGGAGTAFGVFSVAEREAVPWVYCRSFLGDLGRSVLLITEQR